MKDIIVSEKYYKLFDIIISLLSIQENISIDEITKKLFEEGYPQESIREALNYLISQNIIQIKERTKRFENSKISIKSIPNLRLNEKSIDETPKLVFTLPPYDVFGLESEFKYSAIGLNKMKEEFKHLFKIANKSIYICSPFMQLEGIKEFIPLLIAQSKRGVKIKIISRQIKKNESNSRYKEVKRIYNEFKRNGGSIEIKDYHYSIKNRVTSSTHAKLIICDDKIAYIGSGELRKNSFENNFEVGIIVEGDNAKNLSLIFDKLFTLSNVINFDEDEYEKME